MVVAVVLLLLLLLLLLVVIVAVSPQNVTESKSELIVICSDDRRASPTRGNDAEKTKENRVVFRDVHLNFEWLRQAAPAPALQRSPQALTVGDAIAVYQSVCDFRSLIAF